MANEIAREREEREVVKLGEISIWQSPTLAKPAGSGVDCPAEAGVPDFEATTWFGMFAPAGTPGNIVNEINAGIRKVLGDPEMARRLVSQGAESRSSTPGEIAKFMRVESERAKKVIKSAAIKIE